MEDWKEIKKWTWRIILLGLVVFGGIRLTMFILKPVGSTIEVVERTIDGDNIIYNYEYFHKQYEALKSIDKKIENNQTVLDSFKESLPSDREKWKHEDRQELSRLTTIVSGLKSQRADIVTDYNAKSKMINKKVFKADNLPERLE